MNTSKESLPRRNFLRKAVGAGIAVGAGMTASASARGSRSRLGGRRRSGSYALNRRRFRRIRTATILRYRAARQQAGYTRDYQQQSTDEASLPDFIGSFTKTLPHDSNGIVNGRAYRALVRACNSGSELDFDRIPLAPSAARRLANPQAAYAFNLTGKDSHAITMPAAPAFDSAQNAAEIGEVYLHAVLRDIPFDSYTSDSQVSRAASQMSAFSDFRGPTVGGQVTPAVLFRGDAVGDLDGNYISQYLLKPIPVSGSEIPQTYKVPFQGDDHMVTFSDWLGIQRGEAPATSASFDSTPRYIATGRDLAEYVHTDYSYQAYLNAALILLGAGTGRNSGNPYGSLIDNQGAFITFGGAEILSTVAEVALLGLKAAWFHKWVVHRRMRPEVFAGRIEAMRSRGESYPVSTEIMWSTILSDVQSLYGNHLLPMAYPEGSPTHPAYPAGHAVIAGACVTVLKAFFDDSALVDSPVEVDPSSVGQSLQAYSGPDSLTVGGELNKLASNISVGRNIAGVHWRTDGTEGMLLGEQVAIAYLKDKLLTYNERLAGPLTFTGFNGNLIEVR